MPDTIPLSSLGKWTQRFLGLAEHVASWSKDPSTKCGAVIVDPMTHRVVSLGFNGFPAGVPDEQDLLGDRAIKYEMVVHAEVNAILFAGIPLAGMALFTWPFPPCSRCAAVVIQSGIQCVTAPIPAGDLALWHRHNCDRTLSMFHQAAVEMRLIDLMK